jgi:sensor histidine kinase YesM
MDMQKLCKPDAFTFSAIVEENVEDCKILPLVIQTFAENAVKHGLAAARCIEITIYITSMELAGEEFLYIVISDTGNGFPQQILELIETDRPIIYDGCEHIGIRNTLQRIRMAYGEKADIKLSNMRENYGAVVEITLPMQKEN